MSSHIRLSRTCEFCKNEFIAKTIKTRFCSHTCNRKAYKEAKRKEKIDSIIDPTIPVKVPKLKIISIDFRSLSEKEFLTIIETSQLLNITSVTLRRWIKDGIIKSHQLGKKHLIKRIEIDKMLS